MRSAHFRSPTRGIIAHTLLRRGVRSDARAPCEPTARFPWGASAALRRRGSWRKQEWLRECRRPHGDYCPTPRPGQLYKPFSFSSYREPYEYHVRAFREAPVPFPLVVLVLGPPPSRLPNAALPRWQLRRLPGGHGKCSSSTTRFACSNHHLHPSPPTTPRRRNASTRVLRNALSRFQSSSAFDPPFPPPPALPPPSPPTSPFSLATSPPVSFSSY